jgi:DNA-directed RNA polymerase specialized sigma24 family protein
MQTDERNSEEFCREEYAEVYCYAWALLGNQDDALEVVRESFLRLHRLWVMGEIRLNERALLFRIARNLVYEPVRTLV